MNECREGSYYCWEVNKNPTNVISCWLILFTDVENDKYILTIYPVVLQTAWIPV
jgi:hypothetical protein